MRPQLEAGTVIENKDPDGEDKVLKVTWKGITERASNNDSGIEVQSIVYNMGSQLPVKKSISAKNVAYRLPLIARPGYIIGHKIGHKMIEIFCKH